MRFIIRISSVHVRLVLAMTMMWLTAIVMLTCASLATCLMPIELTDETFSSTIEEGKPVFVKFYAPWLVVRINKFGMNK